MNAARASLLPIASLLLLPACTELQNKLLCGKVLGMELNRKQDAYFKMHGVYSASMFQLRVDPPEECRDDWKYDLVVSPDKKSYKFYSTRISKPEKWVTDEKGIIDEAKQP